MEGGDCLETGLKRGHNAWLWSDVMEFIIELLRRHMMTDMSNIRVFDRQIMTHHEKTARLDNFLLIKA